MEPIKNIPVYDGPGVYALTDETGKRYIGSSVNVRARIKAHASALRAGRGPEKMQTAVMSGSHFIAEVLEEVPYGASRHDLFRLEHKWLMHFDSVRNGYNGTFSTGGVSEARYDWPASDYVIKEPRHDAVRVSFTVPSDDYRQHIRAAAKDAGQSLQGYILDAVRERMEREKNQQKTAENP